MGKLQTEYEITCPCCQSTLVIDEGLRRVVGPPVPPRRQALFSQAVESERTRGDALSKRFEEALKQAKDEPVTKPSRDFDLD
jgi:hypothetical protein